MKVEELLTGIAIAVTVFVVCFIAGKLRDKNEEVNDTDLSIDDEVSEATTRTRPNDR